MHPVHSTPLLRRFFAGVTECAFQTRLGVADPPLIDYLTDLLVLFVRCEAIYSVRDLTGRRSFQVAEMVVEAEARLGPARREVHRHIGDFALFWTGIYPEALQRMRGPQTKDLFVNYCEQGKRSYYIASTIAVDDDTHKQAPNYVLERLSDQFEVCMEGLSEVRREWERREGDDDGPRTLFIS